MQQTKLTANLQIKRSEKLRELKIDPELRDLSLIRRGE